MEPASIGIEFCGGFIASRLPGDDGSDNEVKGQYELNGFMMCEVPTVGVGDGVEVAEKKGHGSVHGNTFAPATPLR